MNNITRAIRIKSNIKELETKVLALKKDLRKLADEEQSKLKIEYDYKTNVFIQEKYHSFSEIDVGSEYVVITGTLKDSDKYVEYAKVFGSIVNAPSEKVSSVKYYIKYGILFHDGGGRLVLKDKIPCSDKDWEEIKKGNIKKFLR